MILKISRFKHIDKCDLFLVLLYNGKYFNTFSNYYKGALIRSAQWHFVHVNLHKDKYSSSQGFVRLALRITMKIGSFGHKFYNM